MKNMKNNYSNSHLIQNLALEHIGGYKSPETPENESVCIKDKKVSNISVMNIKRGSEAE